MEKITLIVPALNEERTISIIVKDALALIASGAIQDFVVIDDHSTDSTATIARNLGAKVITRTNGDAGRGQSFLVGLEYCRKTGATVLVLLDSDIDGRLEEKHIERLISPLILNSKIAMSIYPQLNGGEAVPIELTGQRAIRMDAMNFVFKGCDGGWRFRTACRGYGLEKALNAQLSSRFVYLSEFRSDPLLFKPTGSGSGKSTMFMDFLMTGMALGNRRQDLQKLREMRNQAALSHTSGKLSPPNALS